MNTKVKSINIILICVINFMITSFLGCEITTPKNKIIRKNVSFWSLSTGSNIAYVHIPAIDSSTAIPLIFIHGGPGAYQLSGYLEGRGKEWFHKLAKLGFDVYLYDQIGSGLSARLANPEEYTVARHVADLEAIRNMIGAKRFILIGDSWGATLTSNYMAEFPNNVEKAIFTSPGMIDLKEWIDSRGNSPQVVSEFLDWVINTQSEKVINRFIELDSLMKIDIKKAHETVPDSVVDPLIDEFTNSVLVNTVHDKDLVNGMKMHGMGWWVYTMTNFDAMTRKTRPLLKLVSNQTPVLIMRGDSDYIDWEVAHQYETTFQNSRFVQVENAGHLLWLDKPDVYTKTIESFILEK